LTLKDLTAAAGIERVVWIDDLFDKAPGAKPASADIELRELLARCRAQGHTFEVRSGVTLMADLSLDQWSDRTSEVIESGTPQEEVIGALKALLGEDADPPPDYSAAAIEQILKSFGEDSVAKGGAADWPQLRATLADERRTLVIVDREFAVEGVNLPVGDDILQDVVKAKLPTVHVVMLTRSVGGDAEAFRADLAKKLDISAQDFIVTAKVTSDDEVAGAEQNLCSSFQLVFTHQVCTSLTRSIHGVIQRNLDTAVEALVAQSVYDLDRVVFQNSLDEGASELDVLTRILLLRQRVAVDSELGPSLEYFQLLGRLRSLRQLAGPLTSATHGDPTLLRQWRTDEVCDPGDRINVAHSPLMCGDVFTRSGSADTFVLLGQPCDMAVRSDGHRNSSEAIFVGAKTWDPEDAEKKPSNRPGAHYYPIPALPVPGNGPWRLDFRKWSSVNLRVLDFAVFSGSGALRLPFDLEPPVFLLPGWKKLLEKAKARIAAQEALPAEYAALSISEDLKQKAAAKDVDGVSLSYARVGRVRSPWAVGAYAAFATYQARAAFDHDFAEVKATETPAN
jgi:hypothetical protein